MYYEATIKSFKYISYKECLFMCNSCFDGNNCWWIILLILLFILLFSGCGCNNGCGCDNNNNGCGCGC
jgi:hypothetical protein